jgi:hypothetical protein
LTSDERRTPARQRPGTRPALILLIGRMLRRSLTFFPALTGLVLLTCLSLSGAEGSRLDFMPAADAAVIDARMPDARLLPGGIRFREKTPGNGAFIRKGDRVNARYIGRLVDGRIFNQKRSRLHTFWFEVGAQPRQIIRGWEQVMPLMQAGGTYEVAIPSEFGYREHGRPGQVPPHATLLFEIEILEVVRDGS